MVNLPILNIANQQDSSGWQDVIGVEVSLLGYQMGNKEPRYSVSTKAVYHLGAISGINTNQEDLPYWILKAKDNLVLGCSDS